MKIETRLFTDLRLESETFTNPRQHVDPDEVRALALHIGRHGLRVPLAITADGVITAGQRRYLAIASLLHWRATLLDEIALEEHAGFQARAAELAAAVPVVIEGDAEAGDPATRMELALADNLLRVDMTTYEIAQQVALLAKEGRTATAIAAGIGRSRTYVSKMLTAWGSAIDELKLAWQDGIIAYEAVKEIAALPPDDQLHAVFRARNGLPPPAAPRPTMKIDQVRAWLARDAKRLAERPGDDPYLRGVVDTLRRVTGDPTAPDPTMEPA